MLKTRANNTNVKETAMNDKEAKKLIEQMRNTAASDIVSMQHRIEELAEDYKADPWEGTAQQIVRKELRLKARRREAEALVIAVTKF